VFSFALRLGMRASRFWRSSLTLWAFLEYWPAPQQDDTHTHTHTHTHIICILESRQAEYEEGGRELLGGGGDQLGEGVQNVVHAAIEPKRNLVWLVVGWLVGWLGR